MRSPAPDRSRARSSEPRWSDSGPGTCSPARAAYAEAELSEDRPAPPRATPPVETPGPSVTPPARPESDIERAERADALKPDPDLLRADDPLVAEEESAAAAEAREIGGVVPHDARDPAMDPVYQAGGGEQDGWEAAEADLIENATHGEGRANPLRDAFTPEAESDRSSADYGEADEIRPTELDDPEVR
jgi:hypothetical protein